MLKWLSGARPSKGPQPAEVVTDDPLATIHVAAAGKLDGPLEIYAVSRVNPIFDEGGGPADRRSGGRCDRGGSSGYGSSGSGSGGGGSGGGSGARSPCSSSSGGESPKQSAPPTPEQAPTTRTAVTTTAVRCQPLQSRSPRQPRAPPPPPPASPPPPPPPDTPAPPPPPLASSTSASSRLCPIPEGRPVAVPRPVWPPADLEALYAMLAQHSAHAHALEPTVAAAAAPRDHNSDTASSSASSGFGDEHPPSLSTRLVRGERCSSTSMSSSREKLLTARSSDAGAGVGVGVGVDSVSRAQAHHAASTGKRPGVATAATVAASGHWTGVTPGDVCLQSKDGLLWKPDFTLDKAAAERLMRNIQKAKRRRCLCHGATSFLGLAVFLLSVMLVSLAMTGGRRYFGSL